MTHSVAVHSTGKTTSTPSPVRRIIQPVSANVQAVSIPRITTVTPNASAERCENRHSATTIQYSTRALASSPNQKPWASCRRTGRPSSCPVRISQTAGTRQTNDGRKRWNGG